MVRNINKISKFVFNSNYRCYVLSKLFKYFVSDKKAIEIKYKYIFGYKNNLYNPKTLNEKLQWLKLYNRNPLYTTLVDKCAAKECVSNLIGKEYIIPTIGIYNKFDEIDFDVLPDSFVLKCTHDSGSVLVCKNKKDFNIIKAKKFIEKRMKKNFYWVAREWPYKNVKPRILIEKYIEDKTNAGLLDYKFYCFHGKPFVVLVCIDRQIGKTKYYFFDRNWELKRYNKFGVDAPKDFTIEKPKNIDKMFSIAEKLAMYSEAPFVRIDLYSVKERIYFGEFTFYPNAGFDPNRLPEIDRLFGDMVDLREINNE